MDPEFDHLLTPRLVLRRFRAEDAEPFSAYRSDPQVARYQSWSVPYPLERARDFIRGLVGVDPDEPGEWFQFAIATRSAPDRLVGDCAFQPERDEPRIARIGYTLARDAQGFGYATEAVEALLRYLFEGRGKHRVVADCDTRNAGSQRLLERLGFVREGELRESFWDDDRWASEYLYGLLAHEWRASRATGSG